jgi:hypothetical protein
MMLSNLNAMHEMMMLGLGFGLGKKEIAPSL